MKKLTLSILFLFSPLIAHAYSDPLAAPTTTTTKAAAPATPATTLKLSPTTAAIPAPAKSIIPPTPAATPVPAQAAPTKPAVVAAIAQPIVDTPPKPATPTSVYTIDRLGELQSQIAILKAEKALATARLELATSGGTPIQTSQSQSAQSWTTNRSTLPSIKSITGAQQHLTATLAMPDGSHLPVTEGNHIGAYIVSQITPMNVTLTDKHGKSVVVGF